MQEDVQYGEGVAEMPPGDLQDGAPGLFWCPVPDRGMQVAMLAQTQVSLEPADTLQVLNLVETIEELDDVVKVDSNLEISEEALAQLGLVVLGIDPGIGTTGYGVVTEDGRSEAMLVAYSDEDLRRKRRCRAPAGPAR